MGVVLKPEEYFILSKKHNLEFIDPEFWSLLNSEFFKPQFIHINAARPHGYRMEILKRIISGNYEKLAPVKVENCNQITLPWIQEEKNEYYKNIKSTSFGTGELTKKEKSESKIINTCLISGFKSHRSGWTYACEGIRKYHSDNGIILDDFIERTFSWYYEESRKKEIIPYKTPWIGFIHNPISMPTWCGENNNPINIFEKEEFKQSLKHCKALFCLSKRYKETYKKHLPINDVPIFDLKLPTVVPNIKWDKSLFLKENNLVFNGFWLRKVIPFYLLKAKGYKKSWLKAKPRFADGLFFKERDMYISEGKIEEVKSLKLEDVNDPGFLSDIAYDQMLASSVCYVDFYDTVANTAIVDCIARNTPILCPSNPASVDYLGEGYPLFFESYEEVEEILQDKNRIIEASEYIESLDKNWLKKEYFADTLISIISSLERF
jgi:hypothetical protein